MKRFLKVFALLIVSLFLLASGVDSALDHLSHSASQGTYTAYNEKGEAVAVYAGDLRVSRLDVKREPVALIRFLHRS